ncbi:Hypothetical protein TES5_191 [Trichococcus sp. ES5]|nr:Hypothetical protein TES5_191 [Trichococcus sp. ES5]
MRKCIEVYTNFNPRTHEECDYIGKLSYDFALTISIHALTRSATNIPLRSSVTWEFQSTHSRAVRHSLRHAHASLLIISIHALTRSATAPVVAAATAATISIHALTRSATTQHTTRT